MCVLLAAAVASGLVGLELITGKYPRTWFLLGRCWPLWIYCAIYGVLAAGVFLGLDTLMASGKIQLEGGRPVSDWATALVVGVSVKSFLHINLFNVTINAQPFPVGLETFVQLFEPHLLREILLYEFNGVRDFVSTRAEKYPDVEAVRKIIRENIPSSLPGPETGAFRDDLAKAQSSIEALEKGLRFLGKSTFLRIFPA